jgi:MYXO-CTERM domain-containing protein
MALVRGLVAALVLIPVATLGVEASALAGGARAPSLPDGVRLNAHGRYIRDIGDHKAFRHPLSARLLAEGRQPDGTFLPAASGTSCSQPTFTAPFGMSPTDVLTAYDIPAGSASNGAIVAILDSPDSNAASDLAQYRSQFGLPPLPVCTSGHGGVGQTPCFSQVAENGSASTGTDSGSADGETSLDMDMISAACPDCSILLVELTQLADQDILAGAQTAIALGASATSISLGGPEGGSDPTGYTTPGHLVLAASGDFGFDLVNEGGNGASYPASAPDIVAVGGTDLFLNGATYDEAVWNDGTFTTSANGQDVTTSGCSAEFTAPSWQSTPTSNACNGYRATADLAAAATYTTGGCENAIATYCTAFTQQAGGPWVPVEGTSASSPLVAAIFTRLGLTSAISANIGALYSGAGAFNDLGSTSYPADSAGVSTDAQSASTCSPASLCNLETGWDGPSGVGTPNGAALTEGASPLTTLGSGGSGSQGGSSSGGGSSSSGGKSAGSSPGASNGGSNGAGSSGSGSGGSGGDSNGSANNGTLGLGNGGGTSGTPQSGGSGFGGASQASNESSGCSAAPGNSSPARGTGAMALVVGALAFLRSRRKRSGA